MTKIRKTIESIVCNRCGLDEKGHDPKGWSSLTMSIPQEYCHTGFSQDLCPKCTVTLLEFLKS